MTSAAAADVLRWTRRADARDRHADGRVATAAELVVRDRVVTGRAGRVLVRERPAPRTESTRDVGPGIPLAATRGGHFILALAPAGASRASGASGESPTGATAPSCIVFPSHFPMPSSSPLRPLLAIASVLCSRLAAGPAHGSRRQAGAVRRHDYQPGIDVQHYEIRVELPDTGAFLRGEVVVTARRAPGVSTLRLDLVDALRVRGIEVNGRAVGPVHARDKIEVPLGGVTGDSVSVRVRYDGRVTDGLVVRRDAQGRWTWFGDNWPDRARQWLPTVDHPSDKATVTLDGRRAGGPHRRGEWRAPGRADRRTGRGSARPRRGGRSRDRSRRT